MLSQFNLDEKFRNFIRDTQHLCKINSIICNHSEIFMKKEGDFIEVEKGDIISFIPASKIASISDNNESKYRTKMKVGRFIKKFLRKEAFSFFNIKDSDVESFVNLYKSYFNCKIEEFKVVSGNEVKKWYLETNYALTNGYRTGTLWNSCMRYEEKNSFMNIYCKNENQVKLLINLDEFGNLKSRALLWENVEDVDGNKYKVMDRIYSIYEHEVESFKTWATQNGYIYKAEQSAKSESLFVINDEVKHLLLKVKLEKKSFTHYPYIDTFKYFDIYGGILSNSPRFNHDYILVQNDGGLEKHEEPAPEPEPEEEW